MWARSVKLAVGVSLILLVSPAMAQTGPTPSNPYLEEAMSLYRSLQYADVVHKLEMALTVPGNNKEQLCEIYALMGTTHVVLENEKAAKNAFTGLLTIDPEYELDPGISPKILNLFSVVRYEFVPPVRVAFRDRPNVLTTQGETPRMEVEVDDPSRALAGVDLYYRTDEGGQYSKRPMAQVGNNRYGCNLSVDMKTVPADGLRFEYYLQARGPGGMVLASHGSREHPNVFGILPALHERKPVVAEDGEISTPWYHEWWFWTAVSAVTIGAGVGIGFGLGLGSETDVPEGTLGKLKLE